MSTEQNGAAVADDNIVTKLRNVLERVKRGSTEGEVQAATNVLQTLLTKYNLEIADLERSTGKTVAKVGKGDHAWDNPKAVWKWKLDLAEHVAEHFFCYPIVERYRKPPRVLFVGRPDNVESLRMLYAWLQKQIHALGTEERRGYMERTGEHIDPLRWQLSFGEGCAARVGERLREAAQSRSSSETALVVSHKSEISDYLESIGKGRIDGRRTQWEIDYAAKRDERQKKKDESYNRAVNSGDWTKHYEEYPEDVPKSEADKKAEEARMEKLRKKWRRQEAAAEAREERMRDDPEYRKRIQQKNTAVIHGVAAGEKVNLTPFLNGHVDDKKKVR
jgi:hypothetical protein